MIPPAPQNPLVMKLGSFIDLDDVEQAALEKLAEGSSQRRAGQDLIKDGDRPEHVFLLLEGWAYRYKIMADGGRQIMAYLIPGDLCDPHVFILAEMDHSIGLLSQARVAAVPKQAILDMTERYPRLGRALWWSTLVDEAVLRQWLVSAGQRNAYQRLAHLFCELWLRMCQVGLTRDGAFHLPVTQEQLGDTVGLTSVHVNRTLQHMRGEGLISIQNKELVILDSTRMRKAAGFDPKYLHLVRRT